jgi:predicted RNase H-like HicB family nuclease
MTTANYSINIQYSHEDKSFIATVPELPGCMADGETPSEAVEAAQVAIDLWIETAKKRRREIPEPDVMKQHSGRVLLRMPRSLHGVLARDSAREGVSLNQYIITLLGARTERRALEKQVDAAVERCLRPFATNNVFEPRNLGTGFSLFVSDPTTIDTSIPTQCQFLHTGSLGVQPRVGVELGVPVFRLGQR